MSFTVEEISLMSRFDHSSRMTAMTDIMRTIPIVQDEELKRLCEQTAAKLRSHTDEEFASVDFTIEEEGDGQYE